MRAHITQIAMILFIFIIDTNIVFAGERTGSGGDTLLSFDGAMWWSKQNYTITYCVKRDKSHSITVEKLSNYLEKIFNQWNDYYNKRGINNERGEINHQIQSVACEERPDLTIYLGASDPIVAKIKTNFFSPAAFVYRTEYDYDKGLSKGILWMAKDGEVEHENHFPDWSNEDKAYAILLHEVGHLYGVSHFEGTIMTQRIVELLKLQDNRETRRNHPGISYKNFHYNIDHFRQLGNCYRGVICSQKVQGKLSSLYYKNFSRSEEIIKNFENRNFRRLFERLPYGEVKSILLDQIYLSDSVNLIISDDLETKVFEIKFHTGAYSEVTFNKNLFKVSRKGEEFNATSSSSMRWGHIVVSKEKTYPIIFMVNSSQKKVDTLLPKNDTIFRIKITYENNMWSDLFSSIND